MTEQPKRICILGGGFGGLYTALRLSQLPWERSLMPEIVLVDQNDRFLFSPFLYELLTDELKTWEIAPPFAEVLGNTGVRFQQGCVTGIDSTARQVQLKEDSDLAYDHLVIALGGYTPMDRVSGAKKYAIPFRYLKDVYRLEERLKSLEQAEKDPIRVVVVGAGYIGVELACKLADRLGDKARIRLVEQGDTILRTSPDFNREAAQRALEARQIWVDIETTVEVVGEDSITLLYKGQSDPIAADIVLWTVGTKIGDMIASLPLEKNMRGQLKVTPTLQVENSTNIFALGDVAECRDTTGQLVPNTAQATIQQADYCAWNLWAMLTGRPLLSLNYEHLGEMLTLGKNNAVITSPALTTEGYPAYLVRRLAYLSRMPSAQHRLSVGVNWMSAPMLKLLG